MVNLQDQVNGIKGVGPKTAEILKKAGIKTLKDFFYNLPRGYEGFQAPKRISEIKPGKVVIKGKIDSLSTRKAQKRNLSITEGVIRDESGAIKVVWFNQKYRAKQFSTDKEYYFKGNYELKNGRYSLISPSAALVADVDPSTGFSPIYVAHSGLKSNDFHRLMENSRDKFADIPDLLPTVRTGVRRESLFAVHFPESQTAIENAQKYLAYEEMFELILAAKLNKRENNKLEALRIPFEASKIKIFLEKLPFKLTRAQKVAAWEIFQDMERTTPMNRMLQGDVGSGKTMVAALAAYEAAVNGFQVALLAPTAVLATQHYEKLCRLLEDFKIATVLLTGGTKNKASIKAAIKDNKINFVIGTHAILTDDTEFNKLGLVIIDEQHRFGVKQRQKILLKSPKNKAPHLLAMTATPIPRSLQLTLFGDLDVSVLNELPQGRQKIETKILTNLEIREKLYPQIDAALKNGDQIYWICRAIDDSPREETVSVKSRAERLRQLFPDWEIEFLHGRMKPAEKDEIMGNFANKKIDILVSTTVVEVGVDLPNATIIIIEDAEGYGLAQLHQLRGRVGRGSKKSFCYLLTSDDARPSRRLKELERSTDGFHLAEIDLKMRGPGEIYGALQHGALDLRIATLSDTKLIYRAQTDVEKFLKNPENMLKYEELMAGISKYQQITTLN